MNNCTSRRIYSMPISAKRLQESRIDLSSSVAQNEVLSATFSPFNSLKMITSISSGRESIFNGMPLGESRYDGVEMVDRV